MIFIEIIPNLYIGNHEITKNINNLNINYIINCIKDLHFLGNFENYKFQIKDNLEKYEIVKLYEYINETTDYIYKNLLKDKSICVYCETGNQKSALVICAYLIKYGKISKLDAIKSLRTKHQTAFYPEINFGIVLDMFENKFI